MVLVRWTQRVLTRAVLDDTVPNPPKIILDARNDFKRARCRNIGSSPREIFKRVITEEAAIQVRQLIRRTEAGERFINASQAAMEGPRDGPGSTLRRIRRFTTEIRR